MSVGLCSGTVTVTVTGLWQGCGQSCGCINIHKDPEAVQPCGCDSLEGLIPWEELMNM